MSVIILPLPARILPEPAVGNFDYFAFVETIERNASSDLPLLLKGGRGVPQLTTDH